MSLEVAFFATQVPGDIADLAWGRPERIKGLVLCVPMRLDARPFERVAPRLLMISGELGLSAQMTRSAEVALCMPMIMSEFHAALGGLAFVWRVVERGGQQMQLLC